MQKTFNSKSLKRSILVLLIFSHLILKGDVKATINYPSRNDWKEYFNDHLKKVKAKLYNAALEGKIKAYYSDSFTGTVTKDELLKPQAAMLSALPGNAGTDPSQATNSPEVIQGIAFIQKTINTPFEFNTRQDMAGVALLIDFFGINFPFAYIKTDDLKLILSTDELNFLSILSYHSIHSSTPYLRPGFDNKKDNIFFYLHLTGYNRYYSDTTLIENMATMLNLTYDCIKMTVIKIPEEKLFTDLQTGKTISHQGICDIYTANYTTNYNLFVDNEGYPINSITTKVDQAPLFNILFKVNSTKEFKFTLSFKALEDKGLMPVHTWFFKDYLRWKS